MIGYWRVLRAFERSLLLYLAYWAIIGFCYFGIRGVLFNLYLLRLGFGLEVIGLLNAAGLFVWATLALPAGAIGQQIGLREAQLAGLASAALGNGLFLCVELLPRDIWVPWLLGSTIVTWIGGALITVNGIPYVMAIADSEARNYAFPFQQALQTVTTFLGSLVAGLLPGLLVGWLGGSLADPAPFRWVLWLVPISFALGAALFSQARPATAFQDQTESTARSSRPALLFLILGLVVFMFSLGGGTAGTFFNVYLDTDLRVDPAQIGMVIGATQLVAVSAVMLVPWVLARAGTVLTLVLASVGQALALILLWAAPFLGAAAVAFVLLNVMVAARGPAQNLFSQEMVAPRWRTTTSAILTIGSGLGMAGASAAGGYLIGPIGFGGLFLVSAAITVTSVGLVFGFDRLTSATSARLVATKVPKQA